MNIDRSRDTHPTREVFIVRLWKNEYVHTDWNGQIQHVSTGEVTAIRDLDSLLAFFQGQLGGSVEKPGHPSSKLK